MNLPNPTIGILFPLFKVIVGQAIVIDLLTLDYFLKFVTTFCDSPAIKRGTEAKLNGDENRKCEAYDVAWKICQ